MSPEEVVWGDTTRNDKGDGRYGQGERRSVLGRGSSGQGHEGGGPSKGTRVDRTGDGTFKEGGRRGKGPGVLSRCGSQSSPVEGRVLCPPLVVVGSQGSLGRVDRTSDCSTSGKVPVKLKIEGPGQDHWGRLRPTVGPHR